uniref:PLD phosphodiesterase domain-containing protein n=1 Tax=Monopterus albus TaxID=43700 RepID=A0A3Q3IDT4_MONAL
MELRGTRGPMGGQDVKGQGLGFGIPSTGITASSIITAVQQQDYSASVWLRRRDKLEHSQQKCIVIFALVCCFAVLVALIFSAVDVWGEDEDGITEENCSKDCRIVLMENIPDDISFDNSTSHLPLSAGLHHLLDQAVRSVEIVSPWWVLNYSGYDSSFQLAARQVKPEQATSLDSKNAEVHYVNTTALTKGHLHSSFWVVDRRHFYIGSASMDWRSLTTRKELGVLVYNCSCLALDLHRVFSLYWGLHDKEFIPTFWSKRILSLFNRDKPLNLTLNNTKTQAYVSSSPDVFSPGDRSSDLEAISRVIQEAHHFIYISIVDYLPVLGSSAQRYWSRIDDLIREALILRKVRVRLLISCWENTHPLTFNFIWSLKSLCMEQANCSLESVCVCVLQGINHNRFMVTDRAIYLGEFTDYKLYSLHANLTFSGLRGISQRSVKYNNLFCFHRSIPPSSLFITMPLDLGRC